MKIKRISKMRSPNFKYDYLFVVYDSHNVLASFNCDLSTGQYYNLHIIQSTREREMKEIIETINEYFK